MPRPIQITSPIPSTLLSGFGGPANANILPTAPDAGSYNPFLYNPPVSGSSNLIPVASTLVVGVTMANNVVISPYSETINTLVPTGPIALNRNLIISSVADLSAEEITIRGRDASHQILTETLVGPAAAGNVTTTKLYAYLDSFSSSIATAENNFEVATGLELKTSPIRMDYFYPNTSYSVSGEIFGTGATYTVFSTIQKTTLFNNQGIPYTNPTLLWTPLDASLTAATANVVFSGTTMRASLYLSCTLDDDTSYISFTVLQQGVR